MMHRRIEYVVSCDAQQHGCIEADAIDSEHRAEATAEAIRRSGQGGDLNTMLALERQAEKAERAAALPPVADPNESAVDQMIADYLAAKAEARQKEGKP